MVPQDLVSEDYKKRQVYCSGCMARFTLSVARCAGCHADVPLCRGHDWSVDKARDGLPPGRRPGQWKQQPRGKQLALQDVGICRGPGGAGGKVGRGDDPIEECRAQQLEAQRAEMDKVCCYRYACRACSRDTTIRVLHRDEQGGLRTVRCRMCGAARRPEYVWCLTCQCLWTGCTPIAGCELSRRHGAGCGPLQTRKKDVGVVSEAGPLPLATDFSGMDMAAFALKQLLPGEGNLVQVWACDIWREARGFITKNHVAQTLHADVRERPLPGPPLAIYVAGPPCQPWARCGRGLGLGYARADLFEEATEAIRSNRPLAFVLEESDRLPSFQGGQWWRGHVARMRGWGYEVFWEIYNAKLHGVPPEQAPAVGGWAARGLPGCWEALPKACARARGGQAHLDGRPWPGEAR
jgi:hypothetical protein